MFEARRRLAVVGNRVIEAGAEKKVLEGEVKVDMREFLPREGRDQDRRDEGGECRIFSFTSLLPAFSRTAAPHCFSSLASLSHLRLLRPPSSTRSTSTAFNPTRRDQIKRRPFLLLPFTLHLSPRSIFFFHLHVPTLFDSPYSRHLDEADASGVRWVRRVRGAVVEGERKGGGRGDE